MSPFRLILLVSLAQAFAQIGAFTLAALLPNFIDEWVLSNTQAGWLTGIFYGAYVIAVPILVPLTDRIDAKRIYLAAVALMALSHAGFMLVADDFWSGLVLRVMAGVGWAGTYMTGLKALTDRLAPMYQTRAVSWHVAGVGLAGGLSFLIAGSVGEVFGWRWAFAVSALCALSAVMVMFFFLPARKPDAAQKTTDLPALFDFRPILRNRSAMAYSLGYFVHAWELFAVTSWAVTFMTFAAIQNGTTDSLLSPTAAMTLMMIFGTLASIGGNELCIRYGRQRVITVIMVTGIIMAAVIGQTSGISYELAIVACFMYQAFVYTDSSALTAGTSGSAEPGMRGATLAVHSTMGYFGGFLGPLTIGVVLDLAGGESVMGWTLAFGHLAVISVIGPLALWRLKPKDLPGDRPYNP